MHTTASQSPVPDAPHDVVETRRSRHGRDGIPPVLVTQATVGYRPAVTTTTSDPSTETPKRAGIAAAIAVGAHLVVLLAAYVAAQIVEPTASNGFEDLAAVALTFLGGEILVGLAVIVVSAILFRRGWRYTGVGLMGGWIGGWLLLLLVQTLGT
jgi:hypothetical protein